jgi:multidrug efflux pump subunit AcrB
LSKAIQYFIKNSFTVNLLSAFIIISGVLSLINIKTELIPQWKTKSIQISANLKGASPDQIEQYLTYPFEEAIQNLPGIEEINSSSLEGNSSVYLKIDPKLDAREVDNLYQNVKDSIQNIQSDLPEDVENIRINNNKMTSFWFSWLSILNFDDENKSHREWFYHLKDRFKKIPGIVRVSNSPRNQNLYLKLDIDAMARYQINPKNVYQKVVEKFRPLPLGGIKKGENDILIQVSKEIDNAQDVENIIIKGNSSNRLVRLKDIATIKFDYPEKKYKRFTNNLPSFGFSLFKDLEADTLETKRAMEKIIDEENIKAPENLKINLTGDGPAYIERQLNVLRSNGIFGVLLVILVLFVFLGWKTSLMTTFGLPLAYFATFIVLNSLGIKIHLISVVGMILILGILVDDAIIVSEQYMQFLEKGLSPENAAYQAVRATIVPITGAVITTIVAFAPILITNDSLSYFLKAIPWVVIAALGMSWIESFFVLPNHLAHFVKKPIIEKPNGIFFKVKKVYQRLLKGVLKWRYPYIALFIGFVGFSFWFASKNVTFKYDLRIGSEKIRVLVALKESKSLEETEKKMAPLFKLIKKLDSKDYSNITTSIGSAYISGDYKEDFRFASMTLRYSQVHPHIEESKERVTQFLKEQLPALKTNDFEVLSVDKRIDGHDKAKDHTISVEMIGKDQVNYQEVLKQIKKAALKVPETKDVYLDPKLTLETWSFQMSPKSLIQFGLSSFDLSSQLRQFITKNNIHEFRHKGEKITVYSYFQEGDSLNFEDLNNLSILIGHGQKVKVKRLGKWIKTKSLKSISHSDLERNISVDIQYDHEKIKKELYIKKLNESLNQLRSQLPGLKLKVQDADEESRKNKQSISVMAIYCVLLIMIVLALVLNSIIQPLLIIMAIPFGVVGIIWAFYFHGQDIDVMALVGVIGMAGVVVNDSLLLVDTSNKRRKSWQTFSPFDIQESALSRLRPIVLTSITTLGGVFPMAYGIGGDSGFTKPLALAMGWGLLLSTVLTLFLIPAMLNIQLDIMKWLSKKFSPIVEGVNIVQDSISNEGIDKAVALSKKEKESQATLQ